MAFFNGSIGCCEVGNQFVQCHVGRRTCCSVDLGDATTVSRLAAPLQEVATTIKYIASWPRRHCRKGFVLSFPYDQLLTIEQNLRQLAWRSHLIREVGEVRDSLRRRNSK